MGRRTRLATRSLLSILLLLAAGGLIRSLELELPNAGLGPEATRDALPAERARVGVEASVRTAPGAPARAGVARIARAFAGRESGFMVTLDGVVERLLADDRDGSRHQRFLLRLADDRTLLIAHNIDLAERVPLEQGDRIRLRGRYEWNERGGVIHWTHHDPEGDHPGGWIEHGGWRFE